MRFTKSAAIAATAGLALSLLGSAPAAAASNWSASAPKYAKNVSTRIQANTNLGTLQLRKGKYGSASYVWARISSPSSTANKSYRLHFYIGTNYPAFTSVDINGTSYTNGYRLISGETYKACLKKGTAPGGSFYKCVSFKA